MENSEENRALVAFTTLAPLSVGGLVGLLLLPSQGPAAALNLGGVILLVVGVLALGASFLHLGRPFRAYRAIVRLGTSWLSREVVLFGLFLLGLALFCIAGQAQTLVGWVAAALGLIALLSTGGVYHLESRPAWNHWGTTINFAVGGLSAGVLLGLFVASLVGSVSGAGAATVVAALCLVLSVLISWTRSSIAAKQKDAPAGLGRWTLAVRVVGAILALVLAVVGAWAVAWIPAALAELADRISFFYNVVPVSPARQIGVPRFQPVPWPQESTSQRHAG